MKQVEGFPEFRPQFEQKQLELEVNIDVGLKPEFKQRDFDG
jgi:hypothetical protein